MFERSTTVFSCLVLFVCRWLLLFSIFTFPAALNPAAHSICLSDGLHQTPRLGSAGSNTVTIPLRVPVHSGQSSYLSTLAHTGMAGLLQSHGGRPGAADEVEAERDERWTGCWVHLTVQLILYRHTNHLNFPLHFSKRTGPLESNDGQLWSLMTGTITYLSSRK